MTDPVVMKMPDGRVMMCAAKCPVHDIACNQYRFELDDRGIIKAFWWLHTVNCDQRVDVSPSDIENIVSKVTYRKVVIAPGPPDESPEWYKQAWYRFPLKRGKIEGEK